jgi:hypothetical protein
MAMESVAVSVRDALRLGRTLSTPQAHLREVLAWLRRAQDAIDGGVSYGYALRKIRAQKRRGWLAAYPETTGYIICTFLDHFAWSGELESRERALQLAEWEVDVQMTDGAVSAGPLGSPPAPAIFNTGQVLFGWSAAFQASGNERLLAAAGRAADFLVKVQDADGAWRLGSPYAHAGVHTYDARAAWGLLEAAQITGSSEHAAAAVRNLDFALTQQTANGWFAECCISDSQRPLLHTIAYVMEGLLGAGTLLSEPRYVEATRVAADALVGLQRPDGGLAGRFDRSWRPATRWECLTGTAQTALVWLRLFDLTGDRTYLSAARRALMHLCRVQDVSAADPGVRGGLKGADPIWGAYQPYLYPNWASKFLADALLLYIRLMGRQQSTTSSAAHADSTSGTASDSSTASSGGTDTADVDGWSLETWLE